MKKIIGIIVLFVLGLGAFAFADDGGFTCCYDGKSHCVYKGRYIQEDSYFQSDGPCIIGDILD
jgi:hypothetical protein